MVAYSFQPRFVMPILTRTKWGTIRATGKRRHARPGETIQHYTGLRTKQARLFAKSVCTANERIRISFEHQVIVIGEGVTRCKLVALDETMLGPLDDFARTDGFSDFAEMTLFWTKMHGGEDFDGRLIQWNPASVEAKL